MKTKKSFSICISKCVRGVITAAFVLVFTILVQGQSQNGAYRTIVDNGLNGITVSWQFDEVTFHDVDVDGVTYQYVRMKDFTHTKEVGKPALPSYNELIAIPQGADVQINILGFSYTDYVPDFPVHPALQPATDTYGDPEPDFEIDELFYMTDQFYPAQHLEMEGPLFRRELPFGIFTILPVQYNPVQNILRVLTELHFEVVFTGGSRFLDVQQHSAHFLNMVARPFLNSDAVTREIESTANSLSFSQHITPNYIIITHDNYMAAAQELAAWKQQMGHVVEIIDGTGMTSATIKNEVHTRYHSWTPKPDFLLIIGDHPDIPGQVINGAHGTFASDQYYVCTGTGNDFVADMAKGRISVSSATEANNVVSKIIQYEISPPQDSTFYNKSLHAAYFQHASNGYAERRFAQTSEELREYMINAQGYDVTRVYVTGSSVSPTNWNNGLYSAGEPLPLYLRKPTFPWNGNASHINTSINNGVLYVLHRDHGYTGGWGDPAYSNTNVNSLNNGIKTPIVMSINCLTGKYYIGECFAERFLRKYPGGAVGVFAHAEISYSGYNDALAFGLFDAIWANPGVVPVFTGSGGLSLTNPVPHPPILTMGDVANHSLIRMTQTWGNSQYTNELLHYFGDPSMRIYTRNPVPIAALHSDTIQCGQDTTLSIFSTNCPNGIVTLVVDGEVISRGQLNLGALILNFPQLSGNYAILTISDSNFIPYIDTIIITGGCPKSKFTHTAANYCISETITYTDESTGNITTYNWNFGQGAVPLTATGPGPHTVNYATPGFKVVSLVATGTASHTSFQTIMIDSLCKYTLPKTGNQLITYCTGELYDDGRENNYSNSTDGSVTISPPGASSINLLFSSFSFENNADYLRIYDGPNTSSPLIGAFTGYSLPGTNGMISSTTGSITIQQVTNAANSFPGFQLIFNCAYPNSAPLTNFIVTDSNLCTGTFSFTDLSFNGPVAWTWYFGDGNISTQQNPQHQYQQNGTFNVSLVTTNAFGSDSIVKHGIINVNIPLEPITTGAMRCKTGKVTLHANANANINWYTVPTGGNPVASGPTYITPTLTQSTTYYVENSIDAPVLYGGKPDNNGGGGYLAYEHYLVFDAVNPFTLKSVQTYAQSAGNRTVQLKNSAGNTLQSVTLYVPAGASRLILNFEVPAANNLRLVCAGTPNLYRNNSGLAYPYEIPGLLSIHSTSASSNPTGYYYFFYDWEVQEPSCVSNRVPVEAIISDTLFPTAQFSSSINQNQVVFTNQSVNADSYLWTFGDGNYSALHNPTHNYQNPGNYYVFLFANNDCGSDSIFQVVNISTIGIDESEGSGQFNIYPNPATDQVTVEHQGAQPGAVSVGLYDPAGRLVRQYSFESAEGANRYTMDISDLPSGIYMVHLKSKEAISSGRIIKAPF